MDKPVRIMDLRGYKLYALCKRQAFRGLLFISSICYLNTIGFYDSHCFWILSSSIVVEVYICLPLLLKFGDNLSEFFEMWC